MATATADKALRRTTGSRRGASIVVAVTSDAAADPALRFAAAEAVLHDADLYVVHKLVGREIPDRLESADRARETVRGVTGELENKVREAIGSGTTTRVDVTTEPLLDELVVRSSAADLIVLGGTYRRSADALLFGSVARSLVHWSRCPVLVVPHGVDSAATSSITCGVDGSPESLAALRWAGREAAVRGVTVCAAEVRPRRLRDRSDHDRSLSDWVRVQEIAEPTTIVCRSVVAHSPSEELVALAEHQSALLVVGVHRGLRGQHHRCVANQVAAQDRVPVVLVPLAS